VTYLERQGRPMTALVHSPTALDDADLAEAVLGAVRFVVEKERLRGQIEATSTDAAALPTGFVTLVMTDIEGSTALLRRLGDRYGALLNDVRGAIRVAVLRASGREIDARADEFFAVFERPAAALDAAFPGAGYAADAGTYAGIVVDDLASATPRFDPNNPAEGSYMIGLAWSQVATAWLDAGALFRQLRARLLDQQHSNGTWGTSQAEPADDLQSTALAVETLALTGRATERSRRAIRGATRFLVRAQAASGGWPDASNHELPLVDAEIMLALMLSRTEAGEDGLVSGTPLAATAHAATSGAVPAAPLP
jgi:hypothetical protein